eukprot:6736675-Prymnesium_polylepis.1
MDGRASTTRTIPAFYGHYFRVWLSNTNRTESVSTIEYHRVPSSTIEYRRVPSSTAEYRRVPSSTVEYRR